MMYDRGDSDTIWVEMGCKCSRMEMVGESMAGRPSKQTERRVTRGKDEEDMFASDELFE